MQKNLFYVGLDVDDKAFHGAIFSIRTGEFNQFCCRPTLKDLVKQLEKSKIDKKSLKICYETCHIGFKLCRDLRERGYDCEVAASGLIPELPSKRVKTDRLDSLKLAEHYARGNLQFVYVPVQEDEAERDLIRSRSFIVDQLKSLKLHILSICKRQGLNFHLDYPGKKHFTEFHLVWLNRQISSCQIPMLKNNLNMLLAIYSQLEGDVASYNQLIEDLSQTEKYKEKVQTLNCFRGVKTLTSMTVITEIGDIARFVHPAKLVSYLGMGIREYSSGGKERKMGLTKMGNSRARTAIIEACQSAALEVKTSRWLFRRRENADPRAIALADKCMHRLHQKSRKMLARGKNRNVVKVACAREMIGFFWEALLAA